MWKVKLTLMLLLFLPLQTTPIEYDETNVESFAVGRKDRDEFLINMKSSYGGPCRGEWCSDVFDGVYLQIGTATGYCKCRCKQGKVTFVPSKQTCVTVSAAKSFGGECNRGREGKGPSHSTIALSQSLMHGQYTEYRYKLISRKLVSLFKQLVLLLLLQATFKVKNAWK